MKYKYILLTLIVAVSAMSFSGCSSKKKNTDNAKQELKWLDWNTGLEKAKKENKIILIDVYTDWCHWCKVMDRKTYAKQNVIARINKDFIPVKLNPEKGGSYTVNGKTMSGAQLHRWLGNGRTFGFPTTYFLTNPNSDKKNIIYTDGYKNPTKFIAELDKAITVKN